MAETRLCLACGGIVEASKITVHREFHADVETLERRVEEMRSQIRRLETSLRSLS